MHPNTIFPILLLASTTLANPLVRIAARQWGDDSGWASSGSGGNTGFTVGCQGTPCGALCCTTGQVCCLSAPNFSCSSASVCPMDFTGSSSSGSSGSGSSSSDSGSSSGSGSSGSGSSSPGSDSPIPGLPSDDPIVSYIMGGVPTQTGSGSGSQATGGLSQATGGLSQATVTGQLGSVPTSALSGKKNSASRSGASVVALGSVFLIAAVML